MQYERYTLRRTRSRTVYAVYNNYAAAPVTGRGRVPLTTADRQKCDRLARALNDARDAATIAGALIDFGASQSDAWRYAQTIAGAV